ncbi:hypothetical protein LOTGIDRAFT_233350 [Lottia gigantea]|uniref:Major facilitator superfamily (MFS) profile domain-containing protein n=1 Tax=Lottia gigantea TaxID=225164 RepID=V4A4Y2_LOTGI|nr:hypothetical protein LOTGIDRAFT_233350 [Lottia gigantea]ESO91772.1 hypothetical protein LOTGIDRAFT_233350 [Lottia gigantea]
MEQGRKNRIRHVRVIIITLVTIAMIIVHSLRCNVGFIVITILHETETTFINKGAEWNANLPDVDWDSILIGYLHSSFYVGYLLTHIPAGYLTTIFPSYIVFGGSIFLSCLLNLLLPFCINSDLYWVTCSVRFTQGLVEGFIYPACYGILRHWSTPSERGRAGSAVLAGAYAGAVVGFPLAGVITYYVGWQYVFYLNGGLGVLFVLLWVCLASNQPETHHFISEKELEFFHKENGSDVHDLKDQKVPVKAIFTSLPVITLCICDFARNWVFILMLTNEPFYLSLFNFTVAENGLYASIPHIVKVLAAASSGYIADFLLLENFLSTAYVRKLLTTIGFGTSCLGFFLLTFMTNGTSAMVFLTIAVGFTGFPVSGWQINHYDLSPRHASFLVGITSTVGSIGSIMAPLITGYITVSHNIHSWNIVFYITCGVLGFAVMSYLIFGSGQRQSWSNPDENIVLLHNMDPLESKPYSTEKVQDSTSNYGTS